MSFYSFIQHARTVRGSEAESATVRSLRPAIGVQYLLKYNMNHVLTQVVG